MMDHATTDAALLTVLAVLEPDAAALAVERLMAEARLCVDRRRPDDPDVWRAAASADAVVLDDGSDPASLQRALADGQLAGTTPIFIAARARPAPDRYGAWLHAGAWDVVELPGDGPALVLRLRNMLRSREAHLPGSDPPAVRHSRAGLTRVAEETYALARRYGRPLHCITLSLERQDRSIGDPAPLLERLADVVKPLLRGSDVIGVFERGPLFILLPDTDREAAMASLRRIRVDLQRRIQDWGAAATISAAVAGADEVATGAELLDRAARGLE